VSFEDLRAIFTPAEGDHRTIHHRKPREQGGKNTPENLSDVLRSDHNAWHTLYAALPASSIIKMFTTDCKVYGNWNQHDDLILELLQKYANSTKALIKRRQAWFLLFDEKSLEVITHEINTIWLDPDYQIQIGLLRVKMVWMTPTNR